MILLPAKTLGRKLNHTDGLDRKQEIADSLGGSQNDGQSLQEAKISGLVYTLWIIGVSKADMSLLWDGKVH